MAHRNILVAMLSAILVGPLPAKGEQLSPLGISAKTIRGHVYGTEIKDLTQGAAGQKAGLLAGDILFFINGIWVDPTVFVDTVQMHCGLAVRVGFYRPGSGGVLQEVDVHLPREVPCLGVRAAMVAAPMVVVDSVSLGSIADVHGIVKDDIITRVDGIWLFEHPTVVVDAIQRALAVRKTSVNVQLRRVGAVVEIEIPTSSAAVALTADFDETGDLSLMREDQQRLAMALLRRMVPAGFAARAETGFERSERIHGQLITTQFATPKFQGRSARVESLVHKLSVLLAKAGVIDQYRPGGIDGSLALGGVLSLGRAPTIFAGSAAWGTVLRLFQLHGGADIDYKVAIAQVADTVQALAQEEDELRRLVALTSGPLSHFPSFTVDFNGAWTEPGIDQLWLLNTGETKRNVTIVVDLNGPSGQVRNLHYVPEWESGASLTTTYSGPILGKASDRVGVVESLSVSLLSPQFQTREVKYQYAGAEHERDLDTYAAGFHLEPVEVLYGPSRGVALTPNAFFGKHEIHITLANDTNSQTLYWTGESWNARERRIFRDARFSFDPKTISIEMRYPGTNWRKPLGTWAVTATR